MVIQLGVTHGDRYGVRGGDLVHVELLKNWGDGGGGGGGAVDLGDLVRRPPTMPAVEMLS